MKLETLLVAIIVILALNTCLTAANTVRVKEELSSIRQEVSKLSK